MLKKIAIAAGMTVCGSTFAQSSVTLYGILDAGLTYTNNVATKTGHASTVQFAAGDAQSNRWGLRGVEDLGNGLNVSFVLENGFNIGTGALGQGGREFGLQSYVALNSKTLGSISFGRQYDLIGWIFPAYALAANTPAGLMAWSLPANAAGGYLLDNRVWGDEVDNAVKYMSPSIGGFTFGAMYGFGNVAGSIGTNSSSNFALTYDYGAFSAAVAYMSIHNVTTANSTEYIGGAAYSTDKFRFFGNVSNIKLSSGSRLGVTNYEAGLTYSITPSAILGGGYQFQARNNGLGSANQITLTGDYFLSKTTDVYLVAGLGHDHAYGPIVEAGLGTASSSDVQTAVRLGIRHKF
ncbi:porin [Caballeronia sp. DA-9]|uniref:porin n=1 Tax=Caballeronia sp. DA-9 TaxID=3436237 RepID=UPI003F66BC32